MYSIHASYTWPVFGWPRVKISARIRAIQTELFSWFSSVPPGECRDSILKLGNDRFLPNPLQFIIIYLSSYHRRYIV
jgi:hypothetical protein